MNTKQAILHFLKTHLMRVVETLPDKDRIGVDSGNGYGVVFVFDEKCELKDVLGTEFVVDSDRQKLSHVTCPKCHHRFNLSFQEKEDGPRTILMAGDDQREVFKVSLQCPFCEYEEEI